MGTLSRRAAARAQLRIGSARRKWLEYEQSGASVAERVFRPRTCRSLRAQPEKRENESSVKRAELPGILEQSRKAQSDAADTGFDVCVTASVAPKRVCAMKQTLSRFIKKNGEQCLLARNKDRCGKHPIIMDRKSIVAECNIVEEMSPQANTQSSLRLIAPSVIEPVEASNVKQQIDVLQKFVEADTEKNAKGKYIESTLKRDSMVIDQFERKMKEHGYKEWKAEYEPQEVKEKNEDKEKSSYDSAMVCAVLDALALAITYPSPPAETFPDPLVGPTNTLMSAF
ncbi:uncharacterized protein PITG_04732 [Phytophthora infestans T30-4]|uniref:Uncharacterized protein n=1 Tax=Phytophthora infestans (strain T30-4) TaxID=403677 RepID=D0N1X3_PHYIT|nr:uncharacterized protein PITG_04732 [Phytophthora infestans T30-4]EEY68302.1 conserved hypothetical protein [Phytophthora infestans T30-4]|eukprot:XP_002905461.1 conserved hypothetical protein [Phytophthora infestans T30-4]